MSAATAILPEIAKRIAYSRETKDYDCFVTVEDEELYIGSAPDYSDAETKCREYAFSYYEDNHTPEKAAQVALVDELPETPTDAAPARTIEDIDRAQIDAWNRIDADERLFAAVIKRWMDSLLPTHHAMGQAGLILLAAACDGVGPEDDGDEEKVIAARIHHAAYTQGLEDGRKKGVKEMLDYAEQLVAEQKKAA